jgi:hypothetical protein
VEGGPAVLLIVLAASASAQVAPNRTTLYLHPTDVTDARAVWVNPAGLGSAQQASLHLDLTAVDPGPAGRLRQVTLGLASRGFAFGYQRDLFDGGARGHTYRLGYAGGREGLAAGVATALYRGGTSSTGWDAGVLYAAAPSIALGAVVENIGRPAVRDSMLPVTYVPGATLRLAGQRAALSALGRFTSGGAVGYAFGGRAGFREGTTLPIRVLARIDTDGSFRRAGFAFGFSLGGQDLAGAVATTPGDLGHIDAVSVYGVSSRRLTR